MRTRDIPTAARAQNLRAVATEAERKLWGALRDRRLNGAKFVRQAPIGPYFGDFVCRVLRLVVEVDGGQHAESAYDERRDAFLASQGYAVLGFWNEDVLRSIDDVRETILAALEGRLAPFERYRVPLGSNSSRESPLPACGERVGVRGSADLSGRVCAAPHPALRATFSPPCGEKGKASE